MSATDTLSLSRLLRRCRFRVPETSVRTVLEDAVVALARTAQDPKVPFAEREDRIQVDRFNRARGAWGDENSGRTFDGEPDTIRYRIDCVDQGPDGCGPETEVLFEFERPE